MSHDFMDLGGVTRGNSDTISRSSSSSTALSRDSSQVKVDMPPPRHASPTAEEEGLRRNKESAGRLPVTGRVLHSLAPYHIAGPHGAWGGEALIASRGAMMFFNQPAEPDPMYGYANLRGSVP